MRTESGQSRPRKSLSKVAALIAQHSVLYFVLCALLVPLCLRAEAQDRGKLPKIGWLAVRPASAAAAIESFQREFRKLGYIDGRNITFDYRYAEGKLDRLPGLADELVRDQVPARPQRSWLCRR
jgi:hypothetical protein